MTANSELEVPNEPPVFFHRNNPSIAESLCNRLTREGIGIFDWHLGLSWNCSLAENTREDAAKRALDNLLGLNEHGGYGVIHSKGYEEVTIGRVTPRCIGFPELTDSSGETRTFKSFEFEEFASVDLRDEFPDLHERMRHRASNGTNVFVKEPYQALVTDAFVQLHKDGRLEGPRGRTQLVTRGSR